MKTLKIKPLDSRQRHIGEFILRTSFFNLLVIVVFTLRLFVSEFERMDLREFIFINASVIATTCMNLAVVSGVMFLLISQSKHIKKVYKTNIVVLSLAMFVHFVDTLMFKKLNFHLQTIFHYDLAFISSSAKALWQEFALHSVVAALLIPLFQVFFAQTSMPFLGKSNILKRGLSKQGRIGVVIFVAVLFCSDKIVFAYALRNNIRTIKRYAYAVPFYHRLGLHWVVKPKREPVFLVEEEVSNINHPLKHPRKETAESPNLIWIMAEGIGNDQRGQGLMPELDEIAKESYDFWAHHLISDKPELNLFSTYYGVYPAYYPHFFKDAKIPLLVSLLQENGYELKAFLPNKLGISEVQRLAFFEIEQPLKRTSKQKVNESMVQYFKSWQLTRETQKPFAAFIHFDMAKVPYVYDREQDQPSTKKPNFVQPQNNKLALANGYKNAVAFQMKQLRALWRFMQQQIWRDNTILVITGDGKPQLDNTSTYTPNDKVPFIIYHTKLKPKTITHESQLVDVLPILLALLGYDFEPEAISNGKNVLSPYSERIFPFWHKDSLSLRSVSPGKNPNQLPTDEQLEQLKEELLRFMN